MKEVWRRRGWGRGGAGWSARGVATWRGKVPLQLSAGGPVWGGYGLQTRKLAGICHSVLRMLPVDPLLSPAQRLQTQTGGARF
jgi:hypothetical protein